MNIILPLRKLLLTFSLISSAAFAIELVSTSAFAADCEQDLTYVDPYWSNFPVPRGDFHIIKSSEVREPLTPVKGFKQGDVIYGNGELWVIDSLGRDHRVPGEYSKDPDWTVRQANGAEVIGIKSIGSGPYVVLGDK